MTCIDPSTGWFKIVEVSSIGKYSPHMSRLYNQTWLNRYTKPKKLRFDNGLKLKNDYIPLLKDFSLTLSLP